jgi:signal transduction histidine kinase/CheY-like chemotaxis protein
MGDFRIFPIESNISGDEINKAVIQVPNWLTFKDVDERLQFYNFVKSHSSNLTLQLLCSMVMSIAFGVTVWFFVIQAEMPMLACLAVSFRVTFIFFIWVHVFYMRGKSPITKIPNLWDIRNPVLSGNCIILVNAVAGNFILCLRCWNGECHEGENKFTCNPNADEHSIPNDTIASIVMLAVLLPAIFKVHDPIVSFVSWVVSLIGLIISAYLANAINEAVITYAGMMIAVGLLLYEKEHDVSNAFLTLRENRLYYEKLIDMDRGKNKIELEKDHLRNLIGNVAHDLKTPLQAFMSELSGLQIEVDSILLLLPSTPTSSNDKMIKAVATVEEMQKYLNSLRDIYQFMMMAINRAIEFRKCTAGFSLLPSNTTFELIPAVNWAVDKFSNSPSGVIVNVEVHRSCEELCPTIISDKNWLSENILCLGSNACKFTSHGKITVRCSVVTEISSKRKPSLTKQSPHTSISYSNSHRIGDYAMHDSNHSVHSEALFLGAVDNLYVPASAECVRRIRGIQYFVLIEVEDSGIGVPIDKHEDLFQPFGQAQRRAGGTGLGLFSLLKRTEALGGRCGMCDRPDRSSGSCFWFSFPYTADHGNHSRSSQKSFQIEKFSGRLSLSNTTGNIDCRDSGGVYGTCSGKVLLVDDSALILKTISRMLIKLGFEVEIAQNGFDALNLMKENIYLFVLTDIQMPVMDGIEATQRIRAHEDEFRNEGVSSPPQTIIGMSADSDAETKRRAMESGMNAFLSKPIHINELLTCLPDRDEE